jgi:hypothetical protein
MRILPLPYCLYGERVQKLPFPVLEQIVQASRAIAQSWHINFSRETWTEIATERELSYEQYDEMRYHKMIEMLPDIAEEQIAIWDIDKRIMDRHLHLYNLLVRTRK